MGLDHRVLGDSLYPSVNITHLGKGFIYGCEDHLVGFDSYFHRSVSILWDS